MKFRKPELKILRLALLAGSVFVTTSVVADNAPDIQLGKILAYTCHGCHGIETYKNTYPTYNVPKLGGQYAKYIEDALKEYANGDRAHGTMHAQAATLSDQDRAAIAAFFQGAAPREGAAPIGTQPPSTALCVTCHGNDGVSFSSQFPILAGQHRDYLEQAMRDYKSGKRKNAVMAGVIAQIKDEDIPAIAHFFANQKSPLCATDQIRKYGKCQQD